jgi:chromosome segregation ATPase
MPGTESISNGVAKAPENRREPVEAPPPARSDSALAALLNLLAEQREVAQALLEGCATLEERVKAEAMTTQAEREFTEATQKVNATTLLGTQSKELARAAAERRSTLAAERQNLDELVAAAHAEEQRVQAQVLQAEQRLQEARLAAAECSARLVEHETRARECAARDSAAAAEEREATELVVAYEAARLEAEKEARSAKERAEAYTQKCEQSFARIGEIEELAIRIARTSASLKI